MLNEHELEQLIRESQLTTSPALDERILADAAVRMSPTVATSKPSQRLLRSMIPTTVAVLLLLAGGMWWFSRPDNNTWAQVVKAVNDRPWIQFAGKTPNGDDLKMWISTKHQVTAQRSAGSISFEDVAAGERFSYTEEKKQIVKSDIAAGASDLISFSALFQALFRGDEKLDVDKIFGASPDLESVEQSRQEIKNDEGTWYDYVLTLQFTDHEPANLTIRVNVESKLPVTMTIDNPGDAFSMTFEITYPESGPQNVYALGVPRDAKIVDESPLNLGGQWKEVVDSIRKVAEEFEDYRAILVITEPEAPWHVTSPMRVWKKGNRWRLELGIIDPDHPPKIEEPMPDVDRRDWWKRWSDELWYYPLSVSNGKNCYENKVIATQELHLNERMSLAPDQWNKTQWKPVRGYRNDWAAKTTPIIFSYPKQLVDYLASPMHKIELTNTTENGGVHMLIVKVVTAPGDHPKWTEEVTYHLDPSRDCIVLRSSHLQYREENGERVILSESTLSYEDLEQSPKGFWYPTIIRNKSMHQEGGEAKTTKTIGKLYLDFNIDIPDELFEPSNE